MHCGAVDHQSSYEHAISDLAQRSLIIVCKYCGESRVEKKTFFLVNYKCVGTTNTNKLISDISISKILMLIIGYLLGICIILHYLALARS